LKTEYLPLISSQIEKLFIFNGLGLEWGINPKTAPYLECGFSERLELYIPRFLVGLERCSVEVRA